MSRALQLLIEKVGDNLSANTEPSSFLSYAVNHPWLLNVLAASRNHGEIAAATLEANDFPNVMKLKVDTKDQVEALLELNSEFTTLAAWLVTAAREFNLRVFGWSPVEVKKAETSSPRKGKKRRKSPRFRPNSRRAEINAALKQKNGVGLIGFIRQQLSKGDSFSKIGKDIMKITRIKWDPANVNDIAKTYKIK